MAIPSPTLGPNGFVIPSESDILVAVCNEINGIFGGNLNLDPVNNPSSLATPQGQLATSYAATIANKNALFLDYVNQVNPAYSSGRMQDAIAALYFLTRLPAVATSVVCQLTGLTGTSIPAGQAQAKDESGNLYVCNSVITFVNGQATATFVNVVTGPIPCPAGTLNSIYVTYPGWDTIDNAADGVQGADVESQQEFELRRQNSVALNSVGALPSVYAAVASSGASLPIPNVPSDVLVTENTSDLPYSYKGVTLLPHSLYVAALGGDPTEIATAIWKKKAPGCNYNGNTVVTITDATYPVDPPKYYVKFQVPDDKITYFTVTIVNSIGLPSNVATLIKNAIISAFSGGDGGSKVGIGTDVYASRYYAPVMAVNPSIEIVSILVGASSPALGNVMTVNADQVPVVSASNINVVLQ